MPVKEKHGFCTLCRSRCGTINRVSNDDLLNVVPDPEHPTGSAMCMKGRAAPELVHNPNRILYPMRRTRPKTDTDPGWERISWEDAVETIASRLTDIKAQSGAESVAFGVTTPSGTPISDSIDWIERFVRAFQSPNICYGTEICNWHKDYAHAFTFGCGMPTADYANADLIMLWGHNPTSTWLSQANAIGNGREKGARMIVIDPRKTALAAEADAWLQVRPGTDITVALGLIRLLIESGDYDTRFVRDWTNAPFLVRCDDSTLLRAKDCALLGKSSHAQTSANTYVVWDSEANRPTSYDPVSDDSLSQAAHSALTGRYHVKLLSGEQVLCEPVFALLERACAYYTPEVVAHISGVDKQQLIRAAKLLTSSKRVAYHAWTGIGQHVNATQTERAVAIIYALTGSFDTRGGNRIYSQLPLRSVNGQELISPAQKRKALGLAQRPLGPASQGWVKTLDLYNAIIDSQPYKVRAFIGFGTNALVSQGDVTRGIEALKSLEFHVHCDLFETPSAKFADIILPVNTPWEREALRAGFEINEEAVEHIQLRQQMISPRGESKSDTEIVFALAEKLGMDELFFNGSVEAGWNWMLQPIGLTVDQLRQHPAGIHHKLTQRTRKYAEITDGKIRGFNTPTGRVELYSETLLRNGYAPLPSDDRQGPATDSRYPYSLTSVKNGYFCHSQHRSLVSLRKRSPLPVVQISQTLADRKGIQEGDWVQIETTEGHARFSAILSPDLDSHVVIAEFGWWQACAELGRNASSIVGAGNSNYNNLISARSSDPISGSVPMRAFPCDVFLDPEQDLKRRTWKGLRPFKVSTIRPESDGVVAIELVTPDGSLLPNYLPGQHITLCINKGSTEHELTRAYSLTGPAQLQERTTYSIAVRHQRGFDEHGNAVEGRMSSYLNTLLKPGQEVHLGAPGGNFVLPISLPQPVVIFAGGIGITPFISYLESLVGADNMPEVWLHYSNRNSTTHAFAQRLEQLKRQLPRLNVINYYNKPLTGDTKGTDYDSDILVSAAVVPDSLISRRARFYLCGPSPMMKVITEQLIEKGVPSFDIFSEVFRSPVTLAPEGTQQYRISFIRSNQQDLNWTPSSGPILTFAEKQHLKLPSGCRVGQCESCAVRILSGKVYHLNGQEPEDPSVCLTCQAVPVSDLKLDI
ncbi:molybdopterin-dependent oxidoreductase [Zobellella iuensis]|uniref:Molybdopterin-dependent oxidoreductase n=1 Tax=Zobellella iuensis TaxID=2803811 RepID=A0ABS1QU57_9GAMM|nr:molybdopterin-dependent oxidoreductase [Zobellella iuensis]MBL1377658.1 molybdopterin-dependent oxidoreductase [Zobellella iuensis]